MVVHIAVLPRQVSTYLPRHHHWHAQRVDRGTADRSRIASKITWSPPLSFLFVARCAFGLDSSISVLHEADRVVGRPCHLLLLARGPRRTVCLSVLSAFRFSG